MNLLEKHEVELIQNAYQTLGPSKGFLTSVFYRRLFAIAPQARPLFPQDMDEQLTKLEKMLDMLVDNLHQPMFFMGKLKRLARRHVGYGAQPEHYALVGEALIFAIDEITPGGLPEVERGLWVEIYTAISNTMIDAAYSKAS
ncbi:globin domain-containing protein [Thalassobius sp. Cn5-15]|uniref:globin domain-containing protein n=1 Tax=Thalassobius sp. Cn5-15 TaxID=2917763 RepID=UPI001EF263F3|nr:globin domain-containing protein [Thalassobius sp. Cn5-15]MCG7492837.1 globin domain-containing protein [Thalassobius sp. Cn5-15]